MDIFDFLRKKGAGNPASGLSMDDMTAMLNSIIQEAKIKTENSYFTPDIPKLETIKALKELEPALLLQFSLHTLQQVKKIKEKRPDYENSAAGWHYVLKIYNHLLTLVPPPGEEEFVASVAGSLALREFNPMQEIHIPYDTLFKWAINLIKTQGMTPGIVNALNSLKQEPDNEYYFDTNIKKRNDRIDFLLQGDPDAVINLHDAWGREVDFFLKTIPVEEKNNWVTLLKHCNSQVDKSIPTQQWSKKTPALVEAVGHDVFAQQLTAWLELVKNMLREIHKTDSRHEFLRDENHDLLRPLIWCAGYINNAELNNALDDYAAWAYKKKQWVGPISARTGTACMYAFSLLPFKEGVSRLTKFRMKIRNNTILKGIDKIIADVSKKNNVNKDELEEMGVPDFGLDDNGVLRMPFDEYTAVYTVNRLNHTALHWEKVGKPQKSVPAAVKENHAARLKQLKAVTKEIEALLPIYKDRIEQSYLKRKSWNYEQWQTYYLHHPLMGILTKKLIWHFEERDVKTQGIWLNGQLVDAQANPLPALSNEASIQLWHPIGFPTDTVVAWRDFLQKYEITQPFKQAYREVYIVTDAELRTATYSNRFAAHILRQHQFAALCRQRGWHYHLMGQWDSHNTPGIHLPEWNMMAQFYVDASWQEEALNSIFLYIQTDQTRFHKDGALLQMYDVPAMVFTEIMRDIDLFVGVTSIGNDANWQDTGLRGMNAYWQNYSFGELTESANVRAEVLKKLIPRLKIRDKCTFEGKFLVVQGKLRNYKIHMGSGNILMMPNDQYLCIVPGRDASASTDRVFLPFEGDNMLSIIVSKALLLADDDKIKDDSITRQIKS
ncbi:MAG: DUF4132 domain-containing protein [Niastella sp.]|nr:DUF4132 domain-containing protein [Niastella sp.]